MSLHAYPSYPSIFCHHVVHTFFACIHRCLCICLSDSPSLAVCISPFRACHVFRLGHNIHIWNPIFIQIFWGTMYKSTEEMALRLQHLFGAFSFGSRNSLVSQAAPRSSAGGPALAVDGSSSCAPGAALTLARFSSHFVTNFSCALYQLNIRVLMNGRGGETTQLEIEHGIIYVLYGATIDDEGRASYDVIGVK